MLAHFRHGSEGCHPRQVALNAWLVAVDGNLRSHDGAGDDGLVAGAVDA